MKRIAKIVGVVGILAGIGAVGVCTACGRMADVKVDHTEEVERICSMFCEQSVKCSDPPFFATVEDCNASCLGEEDIYLDNDCGEGFRVVYDCIGSTTTCEEFLRTNPPLFDVCDEEKFAAGEACQEDD